MAALREIAARLAAGSSGRTEADIQADVRGFLLEAPFELLADEVVEVSLEAQAGAGRRIDVEAGCAAIEVKKNLKSKAVFDRAVVQLARYVRQRTEERGQRYVGVLTDGSSWILFHLAPDHDLAQVARFSLRRADDADALSAWLESVLATNEKVVPTPKQIVRRLGADSPAAQLDLADLRALYASCGATPEVQLKRELWARLLLAALGTNFEDSDELFVTHTYLVLTAELVAHEIMGISVDAPDADVRELLEGQRFDLAGLHGVVEADFFDWPVATAAGAPIIRGIARRLAGFAWEEVEHDVLKLLYESIIDSQTRKRLGEYYTPDWLAEKIVNEQFTDPTSQRLLDPACGSGTFLFWAVRKAIAACEDAGYGNRQTLEHVVSHVSGMDLHPVAVTLARVTYLLAITPERLRGGDRGEITVPVFLGDSVRWEDDGTVVTQDGMTVRTSDRLELFEQELHFPEGVVEEPQRFDRLIAALAAKAASRTTRAVPKIGGLMDAHQVEDPQDRAAVELVFKKLCRLHDAGRNHVWSYYIRNLARPLSFSKPDGHVDVLVGNPPWLAFRHMTSSLQVTYEELARQRDLWVGGRSAANQDLSDLFVVRSVEQYLKLGGSFAFVMPYAVLSRFVYAGFRTAEWPSPHAPSASVSFAIAEDFARVKPPLFPVPACVVAGRKTETPAPLGGGSVSWSGRVEGHHVGWLQAREQLTYADATTELAASGRTSPYRDEFRRGATLFPRVLIKVEERSAGPLGAPTELLPVRSSRASVEKEPWRSIEALSGAIERQFVRRTHLGATIVAFREREPEQAVVPWLDGRLLDGHDERLDEFPGLAAWWRQAENLWETMKGKSNKLSLAERIDFQGGVRAQIAPPAERVVYTRSGQYLAACRVADPDVLIEQTLYWASVTNPDEGLFLCAIFNSEVFARAVAPLQSRGQHNPRDFAMSLFAVPIPRFDPGAELHGTLAGLARRAEAVASSVQLDATWQFQKARRVTREALREEGVIGDIDLVVDELLSPSPAAKQPAAVAPDLIGVLSTAGEPTDAVRARGMRRRKPFKTPTRDEKGGASKPT